MVRHEAVPLDRPEVVKDPGQVSSSSMESRGSLRQLHQQLGDFGLAGHSFSSSGTGSQDYAPGLHLPDKRAHPPLPSLPPWAASSSHRTDVDSREETTESPAPSLPPGGWRKPRSCFMVLKKLPIKSPDVEEQPHDREEGEAETSGLENQQAEPEERSKPQEEEDPTSSGSSSETNQQEDAVVQRRSPIRGQFFRSWKKSLPSLEDDGDGENGNNGSWSPPATNKWKERALMNPFAKRRPTSHSSQTAERAPSPPERQPETQSTAMKASPLFEAAEPQQLNPVRAPSASRRHLAKPRHRPTTPLPALPLPIQPPRVLRSRGEVAEAPTSPEIHRIEPEAPDPIELRPVRRPLKAPSSAKATNQPKRSTVDALNEIKRKREARRALQAEEKRRVQLELREHGDDAGYKFRRLIQQFREALPSFQQPQQLPPLSASSSTRPPPTPLTTSSNSAVDAPKLSVFIRKRPLAKKELKAKGYDVLSCLFASDDHNAMPPVRRELVCHEPKWRVDCSETLENHQFRFDGVFDEWQENVKVYEATVGPMLPYLVGEATTSTSTTTSLTVFAYGQTGSGKTYTMKAIYRQAASDLFQQLEEATSPRGPRVTVGVSFYEIYMNGVNDLLNARARVQLMEDGDGAVQLLGLQELPAGNADELLELVQRGEQARATSANAVHDDSSRSHALLRVTLYSESTKKAVARLSMVDLAGSERAGDTQSDKKSTRMEGAEINKSLLALKECIRALDRGATHVPFRQSKLTQLLRDSFLSEYSKTIMIATVSPWSESCNHTLNTLRYADRLKEIAATGL